MRRADIEVPNLAVAVSAWARSACYPQGSFYPMSPGTPTRSQRITRTDFRPCSARRPHSQAALCPCTQCLISNQAEATFVRLRYHLGGDRPSQTTRLPRSPVRLTERVSMSDITGWCSIGAKAPTYALQLCPTRN